MIYLDNSATTRPFDRVTQCVAKVMQNVYGNPSSMHMAGVEAERRVREAKDIIASVMKVDAKNIYFTSGGTESDNLAIIGSATAQKRAGMHLITTKTEHPAVLETMKHLEDQGYTVTYLDVKDDGRVDKEALKAALREDTVLVSVMHVNNEIGSVNDIEELSGIVRSYDPAILFHTDAVQSFGKMDVHPKRMGADMVSVSGHKIHGPKGVGILYISDRAKVRPIIFGGGQQKGMRSGTENVPGIAGMGLAAGMVYDDLKAVTGRMFDLKEYFIRRLCDLPDVYINGLPDHDEKGLKDAVAMTAPHIVSASFAQVRAEVLLHALEAEGIYVSAGSACASNKHSKSATLAAIRVPADLAESTLRFSFSGDTSREELDRTIEVLEKELPILRRYRRH